MKLKNRVGLGAMQLGINKDRPNEREVSALVSDLVDNHGLSFVDTADAYCLGEEDFGYGERIFADFAKTDGVTIATKGGFTRPGNQWVKCGDPAYIRSACENSLRRLKLEALPLYQLHQPDPQVPFEETLEAFVQLQQEGKVLEIGLCNVEQSQLEYAQSKARIATVQNPLSILWYRPDVHDPMLRFCEEHDITFLAYAPLGGFRNRGAVEQDEEIRALASSQNLSTYQLALALLMTLSPSVAPIPGSISRLHMIENLEAGEPQLSQDVRDQFFQESVLSS